MSTPSNPAFEPRRAACTPAPPATRATLCSPVKLSQLRHDRVKTRNALKREKKKKHFTSHGYICVVMRCQTEVTLQHLFWNVFLSNILGLYPPNKNNRSFNLQVHFCMDIISLLWIYGMSETKGSSRTKRPLFGTRITNIKLIMTAYSSRKYATFKAGIQN
jgi:hypothetical protein